MKKLLVAMLLVMMTFALVGCGKNDVENTPVEENTSVEEDASVEEDTSLEENASEEETTSEETGVSAEGSVGILAGVWNTYAEEEKFFAMGGDMNNMVDNAPGAFDIADTDTMANTFQFPAELAGDIDEGASLIHGMNANTFTGVAVHLTDASKAETFVSTLKDNVLATQWMCGFPDTLVVYVVNDEYVVYAYGNVDIINTFKNKVSEVYGDSAVLVAEENLAG